MHSRGIPLRTLGHFCFVLFFISRHEIGKEGQEVVDELIAAEQVCGERCPGGAAENWGNLLVILGFPTKWRFIQRNTQSTEDENSLFAVESVRAVPIAKKP